MSESDSATSFRLHGVVEGVARSFPLGAPVVRLGSHHGSDIVLPVSGVSRHHAVLITDAEGLVVEDRGSKNGTKVNGARVARARMQPGDELTVGGATLKLEAASAEGEHLAFYFDLESEAPAPAVSHRSVETDLLATQTTVSTTAQLQWLEIFVVRRTSPGTGLAEALAELRQHLGSAAIGVATWPADADGANAAFLGTAGDVAVLGEGLELHRSALVRAGQRARDTGWQLEIFGSDDLVAGLAPISGGGVAALLIAGDFPGRATCGPWLRLLSRLIAAFEGLRDESTAPSPSPARLKFPDGFVAGCSPASKDLYRELEMACGGDYPVLILGETGSGKELVARTLHRSSPRAEKPFVAVNCAAIPGELLEAEMFGVVRGAATGVAARAGCFRRAEGGTLFLDEIGEMQPELQAKLLRVLEYGEMQPVGGIPVKTDVRVLSATNVEVEKRIADGGFRADLYYRLAASTVTVPPLRRRPEDLPALIQHFIHLSCEELGVRPRGLSQQALGLMVAYPWPGNVRELQHVLRRAVQSAYSGQVLDAASLPARFRDATSPADPRSAEPASHGEVSLDLRERVAEVEKDLIRQALARTGGHRVNAAKLLGISRNTLAVKITSYGLIDSGVGAE